MYELVGHVSAGTIRSLKSVVDRAVWKDVIGSGRDYKTYHGLSDIFDIPELTELWPLDTWEGTFFLNIPPGGQVHKHVDDDQRLGHHRAPAGGPVRAERNQHGPSVATAPPPDLPSRSAPRRTAGCTLRWRRPTRVSPSGFGWRCGGSKEWP